MGRYDPLSVYVKRQRRAEIRLSFADIERIVGRMLPKAAQASDWWTGSGHTGTPAPQRQAWGVDFLAVPDPRFERVLFVRRS